MTHNCNNFSDAVRMYLMNKHIPEDILNMPEKLMSSGIARLARPFLNKYLGNFDADGKPTGAEHAMKLVAKEMAASGEGGTLTEGGSVNWIWLYLPKIYDRPHR